jgi:hypothetical protein
MVPFAALRGDILCTPPLLLRWAYGVVPAVTYGPGPGLLASLFRKKTARARCSRL